MANTMNRQWLQASWYAWGRLDEGGKFPGEDKPAAVFSFAEKWQELSRQFDAEERVTMPSMVSAWESFVRTDGHNLTTREGSE